MCLRGALHKSTLGLLYIAQNNFSLFKANIFLVNLHNIICHTCEWSDWLIFICVTTVGKLFLQRHILKIQFTESTNNMNDLLEGMLSYRHKSTVLLCCSRSLSFKWCATALWRFVDSVQVDNLSDTWRHLFTVLTKTTTVVLITTPMPHPVNRIRSKQ